MAFAYCPHCQGALDSPSAYEDLQGNTCPHCSGHIAQRYSVEEWIITLDSQIEAMCKRLRIDRSTLY